MWECLPHTISPFLEDHLGLPFIFTLYSTCDSKFACLFGLKRQDTWPFLATKHPSCFHTTRHHETLGNKAERLFEQFSLPWVIMKILRKEKGEVQATWIFPWPHRSSIVLRTFMLMSPSIFYTTQVWLWPSL